MFEMMIAEKMISEHKNVGDSCELSFYNLKPVAIKPSLFDRVLPVVGQALINTGLKLKYRHQVRLSMEEAHSPNFLIML